MTNCAWFARFSASRSEYLCFESSDHIPIISYFTNQKKRPKGLFRFDRSLKDNEEVQELISKTWKSNEEASVEQRIGSCRRAIIQWNKEKHKNSQEAIAKMQSKLEKTMSSPTSRVEWIHSINSELALAHKQKKIYGDIRVDTMAKPM